MEQFDWIKPVESADELSVVILGDLRLLGVLTRAVYVAGVLSPPGEKKRNGESHVMLERAFPIGAAMAQSREMGTINVPALGFLHWCVYEPIHSIDLTHASYASYKVKHQSEATKARFMTAYNTFVEKCLETKKPKTGLIVTPSMAKVEEMGERAGGPANLVSILQGKEPER